MSAPRSVVALTILLALVAAACTSEEGSEATTDTRRASTTLGSDAGPGTEPPPPGEGLAALTVEPSVASPGEEIVVSVPFAGTVELVGPEGTVVAVDVGVGDAGLPIPVDLTEGEYLIVLRADGPGIGLGAVRVATGSGLWLDSDRLTVADDDVVRLRVTSSGLDSATPILIGLGAGWEDQLGDETNPPPEEESADDGPAGVLTLTQSGVLITGGFEPVTLGELIGRDLFLPGTEADAVQLIALGDEPMFSNLLPIARCNEPAIVSGSIGGPGGVRLVSVSGRHQSVAAIAENGEFSLSISAGEHMLFGWLDGEPPASLAPIPLDAPCGSTVTVGGTPAAIPPVAFEPLLVDDAFAVEQPPCRTLLITRITNPDGTDSSGVTQLVAGTLRSRLPLVEVITAQDVESIVAHAFDPRWKISPGSLIPLWGLGDRFGGDAYVAGVRHDIGGTLGLYPSTDRDAATLLKSQASSTDWVGAFADAVAGSALCIQAPPIHAEAASTTEWQVSVTDLAGEPYRGATVEVTSPQDSVTPARGTVDDGPVPLTYTAGADASVEDLTVEAYAEAGGRPLTAFKTVSAGYGFTYVLAGGWSSEVDSDEVPLAGNIGASLMACAPRPGGPYRGIVAIELANYLELAAISGAILAAVGSGPAGGASPRGTANFNTLDPFAIAVSIDTGSVMSWMFGVANSGISFLGTFAAFRYRSLIKDYPTDDGADPKSGAIVGSVGLFDDARFRRGRITLLENDGNRLVGTLNAGTGTVTVTANGLKVLTATLIPAAGCPIELED